ncbi:MAG: phage head closure protein [Methylococcales bacterium]|jgi:SPP1 family predicted phage head-tail adaptor|nr:phage head closure protein [Methylococcales bacterium]
MNKNIPNISAFYHSINIETPTLTKQSNGEDVKSWGVFLSTMAAIQVNKVNEKAENNMLYSDDTFNFYIRTKTGINRKMRVVYNSDYYNIVGIITIGRRYQIIKTKLVE